METHDFEGKNNIFVTCLLLSERKKKHKYFIFNEQWNNKYCLE